MQFGDTLGGAKTDNLSIGVNGGGSLLVHTNGTLRTTFDGSGNMIFIAPTTPPSLTAANQVVANMTSNTNLRVSGRGSDGTTRVVNFTLA